MIYLAFGDQCLEHAGDVFDWNCRVDPVLIENVDAVCPKALQGGPLDPTDMLRVAVGATAACAGPLVNVKAELGSDHNPISDRQQRLPEQLLVGKWPVGLRGTSKKVTRARKPLGSA